MKDKILLIGCGNLGKLLLQVWHTNKHSVAVLDKRKNIKDLINKETSNIKFFHKLIDINLDEFSIIVFCIKPQDSKKIFYKISKFINTKHIVVSLVAGLEIKTIKNCLNKSNNIIRGMPNIFCGVMKSSTAIFSNDKLSKNNKRTIDNLFNLLGVNLWLKKENEMNFFTAMFGGGPAYFFYFLNMILKIAKSQGIPKLKAERLLKNLLAGSLKFTDQNKLSFSKLISIVTSKGGTTEEAIKYFEKNENFFRLFSKGIEKATSKSKKISKSLN
ncbi:MAG: hypothetical protein CMP25_00090 [Rickettsiales bacterium]|nr:hypothetical protein [Rickettsiales bacterium]